MKNYIFVFLAWAALIASVTFFYSRVGISVQRAYLYWDLFSDFQKVFTLIMWLWALAIPVILIVVFKVLGGKIRDAE